MADWGYPHDDEDQVLRSRRFGCRHPEVTITSHVRDVPSCWTAVWRDGRGKEYTMTATDLELLLDQLEEIVPGMAEGRWPVTTVQAGNS
jgi:hypothetical protein